MNANTVPKMGWDVASLPGTSANPETGAYDSEEVSYAPFVRIQWPKYSVIYDFTCFK